MVQIHSRSNARTFPLEAPSQQNISDNPLLYNVDFYRNDDAKESAWEPIGPNIVGINLELNELENSFMGSASTNRLSEEGLRRGLKMTLAWLGP